MTTTWSATSIASSWSSVHRQHRRAGLVVQTPEPCAQLPRTNASSTPNGSSSSRTRGFLRAHGDRHALALAGRDLEGSRSARPSSSARCNSSSTRALIFFFERFQISRHEGGVPPYREVTETARHAGTRSRRRAAARAPLDGVDGLDDDLGPQFQLLKDHDHAPPSRLAPTRSAEESASAISRDVERESSTATSLTEPASRPLGSDSHDDAAFSCPGRIIVAPTSVRTAQSASGAQPGRALEVEVPRTGGRHFQRAVSVFLMMLPETIVTAPKSPSRRLHRHDAVRDSRGNNGSVDPAERREGPRTERRNGLLARRPARRERESSRGRRKGATERSRAPSPATRGAPSIRGGGPSPEPPPCSRRQGAAQGRRRRRECERDVEERHQGAPYVVLAYQPDRESTPRRG